MNFAERILVELQSAPGLTDRELTTRLISSSTHPSQVNQTCRLLEARGKLKRAHRPDGKIGNFPVPGDVSEIQRFAPAQRLAPVRKDAFDADLSEDEVKTHLDAWLRAQGWVTEVAWGRSRGIDIRAVRGSEIWIIEAKGCGSLQPMRVNYFIGALGELLQRMDVDGARYSLAFPDMKEFRGLWDRLPKLARTRTGITTLFVDACSTVSEVN